MRSVDTNVLVRLLTRDDEPQRRAAERFVPGGAWVSHLVLAETSSVLQSVYDRSAVEIATAIDRLLDHEHIVVETPEVVRAALETFRRRPSIGFSDCLMLEQVRKAGHLPLGTFDRDLGRLDGAERLP
jgi:predicted nucleic-acid-binding protein